MRVRKTLPLPLAMLAVLSMSVARADELPPVERLQESMGTPPSIIEVQDAILSVGERQIMVEYIGYPAADVMAQLFGTAWHARAETVELRALDGFVSRVDVARFLKETAYLVFARADGAPFTVDQIRQNRKDVPLGPYYLVWDNVSNPALLAEGSLNWPYQVGQVNLVSLSDTALLPDGLAADLHEGAELARRYCLQCHKVNGYGGDKSPGNPGANRQGPFGTGLRPMGIESFVGAKQHQHAAAFRSPARRRAAEDRKGVVRLSHGSACPEIAALRSAPEAELLMLPGLESTSFEDAVRNAISLGENADTLAAVAGPIAEAMHGIPEALIATAKERYLGEALDIVDTMEGLYLGNRLYEHCA